MSVAACDMFSEPLLLELMQCQRLGRGVAMRPCAEVVICSFAFIMVPCRMAAVDVFALGLCLSLIVSSKTVLDVHTSTVCVATRREYHLLRSKVWRVY